MNILREMRRVKQRSMATRILLILIFSVIFIINTYAWFSADKEINLSGIQGDVTSWDVSYTYYVNEDENEVLDGIATFTIDELYPGMPEREDIAKIYNVGDASTRIQYELISVKVFGQEVLNELDIQTQTINTTGARTTIFKGDTAPNADGTPAYPFTISYTYDKTKLIGKYENDTSTPNSFATLKFYVHWTYENNGTEAENLAKDTLDTQFGKDAYEYYQDEANDPTKAIEVQVKITSNMIHPDLDPDYQD